MHMMRNLKRLPLIGLSSVAILAMLVGATFLRFGSVGAASPSFSIKGNTPGFINHATDQGALNPATVITVTAWLKLHNTAQLDQLVASQHQKGNANFHQWLTQSQFNATYGPTVQELNAVSNFLTAHKLSVVASADDNSYVKVTGAVGDVERAFHVQIDNFGFDGVTYYANTSDPNVNDASGAHIDAISGLDNYGFQPTVAYPTTAEGQGAQWQPLTSSSNGAFFSAQCFFGTETHTFTSTTPSVTATYTGARYGAPITNSVPNLGPCGYQPSELQAAYSMTPLYNAGLKGAGQTVVITDAFGSATIQTDAEMFSQLYGLPDLNSSNFHVLRAPGAVNSPVCSAHGPCSAPWADEVTLDVEWVHAMAPGATIDLVIGPNNANDLDEAINYAVVHHLGNTISNSWSSIEGFGNPARFNRDNRILEEAAAQGIDVNFSSGDSGDFQAAVGFKTVGFPTSSPFATGIGGSSLSIDSNNAIAFQTGWGTNIDRVANRISQGSTPVDPPTSLNTFDFGAGGGSSLTFAKPDFQSGLPGTMRQVPDVSMLADPFTGVEIIQTVNGHLSVGVIGGTSLACPMFSAIMAIASEKAGHPLGQAAPLMYQLSSAPDTSQAIYDVTASNGPANVTGTVIDAGGTTNYTADQLAAPLGNTTHYYSALYNSPFSTRWFVLTFGTDSSLTTASGWDNVTGVGTPNGVNFVNEVAGL